MIYVLPRSGLGNRMRVIDSAVALGADLRRRVEIYWVPDDGLACPFSKLFEPFGQDFVTVRDCRRRPVRFMYLQPHVYALMRHLDISPNRFAAHDARRLRIYPFKAEQRKLFIASHSKFYHKQTDYTWFTPIEVLRDRIAQKTASFDTYTIGIHIRRTDHSIAIEKSPDALFLREMHQIVGAEPRTRFYLATDSEHVKRAMASTFGARLMTSPYAASRNTVEGMQEALVELYTLAATSRIIGSFGSSYSTIASQIGQIELTRLAEEPEQSVDQTKQL